MSTSGRARGGTRSRVLSSRDPAVAAVRCAVRGFLSSATVEPLLDTGELAVAVSGGADSLALAALAVPIAAGCGLAVRGLVVDHGLQQGSAAVAARAADQLAALGAEPRVMTVTVSGAGGVEAAARRARYAALREAAPRGGLVLLGHTLDDQAETVLLGLGRGSGPRSMAGMRPLEPPWGRPLLEVTRAQTVATCAALGLTAWQDPHNDDPRFTRVRLRHEVLPLLEDVLAGGVAGALARTAAQLRDDLELLDTLADDLYRRAAESGPCSNEGNESHTHTTQRHKGHFQQHLRVTTLEQAPAALRRRVLRRWLLEAGVRDLTDAHLRAIDRLVTDWRGQGDVWLPGGLATGRRHGTLCLQHSPV